MNRFIGKLSDSLATQSSRRGFLTTIGKIALGAGGAVAGIGSGAQALAATCCNPACNYGNNTTCPPWNCPGLTFCCGSGEQHYGCQACLYCNTQQVACYATYWGPGSICPSLPS